MYLNQKLNNTKNTKHQIGLVQNDINSYYWHDWNMKLDDTLLTDSIPSKVDVRLAILDTISIRRDSNQIEWVTNIQVNKNCVKYCQSMPVTNIQVIEISFMTKTNFRASLQILKYTIRRKECQKAIFVFS